MLEDGAEWETVAIEVCSNAFVSRIGRAVTMTM